MKTIAGLILIVGVFLLASNSFAADDQTVIDAAVGAMFQEDLVGEPKPSTGSNPPTLTLAKVRSVVAKLTKVEKWNGYSGIAQVEEVSPGQVKAIKLSVDARLRELAEAHAEPIPK